MVRASDKRGGRPRPNSPQATLARCGELHSQASELFRHLLAVAKSARRAYENERDRIVREQLDRMPISSLKTATGGKLRLGAVEAAGTRTVGDVLGTSQRRLQSIPGVGVKTATQIIAAAESIKAKLITTTRVRFNVDERPGEQTQLLALLHYYEQVRPLFEPLQERMTTIEEAREAVRRASSLGKRIEMADADLRSARQNLEAQRSKLEMSENRRVSRFVIGRSRKAKAEQRIAGVRSAAAADVATAEKQYDEAEARVTKANRQERIACERADALVNAMTTADFARDISDVEMTLFSSDDQSFLQVSRSRGASDGVLGKVRVSSKLIWKDYIERSAEYNGLLIEVSGQSPDEDASHGFLPEEIVEKTRRFQLDTSLLRVSLRGYQSFGAKFALVQGRVLLGDEMGLGKTIEALAALSHLKAHGASHFLVVCPASVMAQWEHEIIRRTELQPTRRLHGPERDGQLRRWATFGGLGITTFGTLGSLSVPQLPINAMVVDEAHYVKNPDAKRTQAVRSWLDRSELSLLMSGTPMENRLEEFCTLIHHIRPDVAAIVPTNTGIASGGAFRKSVGSVYLRRNQEDVLSELPDKIEIADWLTLSGPAAREYRSAVASGNFMAMRRAAFLTRRSEDSPKLQRLCEIVEEAWENDRKIVVFSFFRDVIERVRTALGSQVVGVLAGSVPPAERQIIIDRFSERKQPAVLVSQIEVGGVGLNLQAASVVILTEPQWKPSTEDQAIARCHRLGQARRVVVHRLLTENSVDERMLVTLAHKKKLFAEYVRDSAMKNAAPEAVDITDDEETTRVATQAEQERRIIELERRRLGIKDQ